MKNARRVKRGKKINEKTIETNYIYSDRKNN
jgi:hypothetical protein